MPLQKFVDVQDTDKSSHPVATWPHIEDQVDKRDCEILDSRIKLVCPEGGKTSLGVSLGKSTEATGVRNQTH